jgi:short-subunit dehydrogenase
LKDIDIGILILNAGWGEMSPFINLTDDEIEQHVNINAG